MPWRASSNTWRDTANHEPRILRFFTATPGRVSSRVYARDSMRQIFTNVRTSNRAFQVAQPRWPFDTALAVPGQAFAMAVIAAGLLTSNVAAADPLKQSSDTPRTVSSAKPVVVLPRESTTKQQAKNFVSVGPILGFTSHMDAVNAPINGVLGVEISYVRFPYSAFRFGMGGFAQAQTVGFDHARYAFGPQFNFMMFGAEVGAFIEEGNAARAMTVGVHASPFVSLGFFSAALRLAVPIGTLSEGTPYGIDVGLVCAIKLPIPLDGQLFGLAFH